MQIFITFASFAFQRLPGQHGFDLKMSGNATGCMFGPGAYFAESSSKCDEYAKEVQQQIETNHVNPFVTPWKIHMEPTNHPFSKENDLPNLHDYGPC